MKYSRVPMDAFSLLLPRSVTLDPSILCEYHYSINLTLRMQKNPPRQGLVCRDRAAWLETKAAVEFMAGRSDADRCEELILIDKYTCEDYPSQNFPRIVHRGRGARCMREGSRGKDS